MVDQDWKLFEVFLRTTTIILCLFVPFLAVAISVYPRGNSRCWLPRPHIYIYEAILISIYYYSALVRPLISLLFILSCKYIRVCTTYVD